MSKITGAAPSPGCPLWRSFLHWVTGGDQEQQDFLQRAAGYCLTGSTREHALFFIHGSGGNGKGVFLETLAGVLGTYATMAPMEVFTASKQDRHPTELAMMRRARLVIAQETEEGRRWAESRIKGLTGGDRISAHFMRQDFFTFTPEFKLFIAGNHLPALRNVDPAMKRRLKIIPFRVQIGESEEDQELPSKLRQEWPGILQWAIDGCLEWQRLGLAPPTTVRKATDDYFKVEDVVGQWLSECCMFGAVYRDSSTSLYMSWTEWATRAGEPARSQKLFSQDMVGRGFGKMRLSGGKAGFEGVALKPAMSGGVTTCQDEV